MADAACAAAVRDSQRPDRGLLMFPAGVLVAIAGREV
nr:hypothetical protein [Streptomonospora litoralis]